MITSSSSDPPNPPLDTVHQNLLRTCLCWVRVPNPSDEIWEECCISFETAKSEGGLYIDMFTFDAFGSTYVYWNHAKTEHQVYLHINKILDTGVQAGFRENDTEYIENFEIVILPHHITIAFPSNNLPEKFILAAEAIIRNMGAKQKEQVATQSADTNLRYTEMTTAEGTSEQEPLPWPRYNGLVNLGNSSYLNAVMQVVLSTSDFCSRYYFWELVDAFYTPGIRPTQDLDMQLTKLAHGLRSGLNSIPATKISPRMFKSVIVKNHPKFSTTREQDAMEFFLHLMDKVAPGSNIMNFNPCVGFRFGIREELHLSSGEISSNERGAYILSVDIPPHKKELEDDVEGGERSAKMLCQRVTLMDCLNFHKSSVIAEPPATRTVCLISYPKYLVLHVRRFVQGEDGAPKKLDDYIDVPEIIDISFMCKDSKPEAISIEEVDVDDDIVYELTTTGQQYLHCKKADYYTSSSGVTEAYDWLCNHVGDLDINETYVKNENFYAGKDQGIRELYDDGRYQLIGLVNHVGSSIDCGHYVAHILKNHKWMTYDDDQVCVSKNPPIGNAYLYFFRKMGF